MSIPGVSERAIVHDVPCIEDDGGEKIARVAADIKIIASGQQILPALR